MPFDAKTFKQPWVKYSVLAVAGIGIVYIIYKNMGSASGGTTVVQSGSGYDPAALQAATQSQAQQFQLALDVQKGQIDLQKLSLQNEAASNQQANQISGTLQLANIQTKAASDQAASQVGGQIQLAQIQSQNIQSQYASQVALGQIETQAQLHISDMAAQTQLANSQLAANQQNLLARTAADVQLNQLNFNYQLESQKLSVGAQQIASQERLAAAQQNINADLTKFSQNTMREIGLVQAGTQRAQINAGSNGHWYDGLSSVGGLLGAIF